jgi:hypothetical protein
VTARNMGFILEFLHRPILAGIPYPDINPILFYGKIHFGPLFCTKANTVRMIGTALTTLFVSATLVETLAVTSKTLETCQVLKVRSLIF